MTALTNARIDRMTAKFMGYKKDDYCADDQYYRDILIDEVGSSQRIYFTFTPTTDLNQAWQVEEKISEMDLRVDYIRNLRHIVVDESADFEQWSTTHATARQRCLAALQVMESEEK